MTIDQNKHFDAEGRQIRHINLNSNDDNRSCLTTTTIDNKSIKDANTSASYIPNFVKSRKWSVMGKGKNLDKERYSERKKGSDFRKKLLEKETYPVKGKESAIEYHSGDFSPKLLFDTLGTSHSKKNDKKSVLPDRFKNMLAHNDNTRNKNSINLGRRRSNTSKIDLSNRQSRSASMGKPIPQTTFTSRKPSPSYPRLQNKSVSFENQKDSYIAQQTQQ